MTRLHLTAGQRSGLERQLAATRDATVYCRTLAVLEVAQGRTVTEIASLLRVSRVSIHQWLARYGRDRDPGSLLDHRGGNHPSLWTPDLRDALRQALAGSPDQLGYQAVEWTCVLLREHLAAATGETLSAASVRRQLAELGFVWKRPRYVLEPDPEREKKTRAPAALEKPAFAERLAVRGRDRLVAVPAAARRLASPRPTRSGVLARGQRQAGRVRDDQPGHRPATVPGAPTATRR
jgi:transposase